MNSQFIMHEGKVYVPIEYIQAMVPWFRAVISPTAGKHGERGLGLRTVNQPSKYARTKVKQPQGRPPVERYAGEITHAEIRRRYEC